ncbi:hypothetical protein [Flavobacterium selenitireducens]|uniref:hypothetical protein n=1 Tax=Flavobacterium selenitireducens TaxID=2722704 RepID=UPI00168BDFB8|nr:hypothetical protein [Flavobacterium selenitireducens]MBD3580930.1 hypothetical protein [Flavobacterium selenitireducens]
METDRTGFTPEDEISGQNQSPSGSFLQFDRLRHDDSFGETANEAADKKRHHSHHGIGRYRSFSNYSSASDQPHTNTGW